MDLNLEELVDVTFKADSIITVDLAMTREATIATATGLIETDGDGVELYKWSAASKLDPADKHDKEIAIKLATGRALLKAGNQLIRQANGRVKNIDDNKRQSVEQKATRTPETKKATGVRARVLKAAKPKEVTTGEV